MDNMTRYIVTASAPSSSPAALLLSSWAALAESAEDALDQFELARPGWRAVKVEPADPARRAFFGESWYTDAEREARVSALAARYDARREAAEAARERLREMSLAEFAARAEYEARRAAGQTENEEGVFIGDLFYCEWGYEQTNVTYFQVVGLKGKHTAVLRPLACRREETGDMEGLTRPIRDAFEGERAYTARTRPDGGSVFMKAPEDVCSGILRPARDGEVRAFTAYA